MSRRFVTLGFIMSCLIVMYHCGPADIGPVSFIDGRLNDGLNNMFNALEDLSMSYFFATSGFLFFYNYNEKGYKTKLKRRVMTLLVPYVIWNTVTGYSWLYERHWDLYIRKNYLLEQWPYDFPLWYMYVIFLLTIPSPILYCLFKSKKGGFVALVFSMIILYFIQASQNPTICIISGYGLMPQILPKLSVYFMGVYFGIHKMNDEDVMKTILLILLSAFIVGTYWDDFFVKSVIVVFPILLIYFMPQSLLINNVGLTNLSFLVYAIHAFTGSVKTIVRPFLAEVWECASFVNVFGRILSLMFTIICAYVLWYILSKLSPRILQLVTGNRVKAKI